MYPLTYEGDIYRPPSEAGSLILQATIGCSHNRCTFCAMYKQKKYRERELGALIEEIGAAGRIWPRTRRVFLADGNALAMDSGRLCTVLQALGRAFPQLERVSLYANPHDLLRKESAELAEMGALKLKMIYLGVESGSSSVLQAVKKGVSPQEIARGATRVKKAGIPLSITVINGLAGLEGWEEHAGESARLLSEIDPDYLGLLSLMVIPGTPIYRRVEAGELTLPGPWEMIREIRLMVEQLSLSNCTFRANHASNYLPLKAVLSRDRVPLLAALDDLLKRKAPGVLRSEGHRLL